MQNLMARLGRPKECVVYEVLWDSFQLQREAHLKPGQLDLLIQTEACRGEASGAEAARSLRLFCPQCVIGCCSSDRICWEAS